MNNSFQNDINLLRLTSRMQAAGGHNNNYVVWHAPLGRVVKDAVSSVLFQLFVRLWTQTASINFFTARTLTRPSGNFGCFS